MEILKEVAKDRLVIMVTHNPVLANKYSTRIIQMIDGEIISDSSPLEKTKGSKVKVAGKKPSMSFATAFMLSLKNLFTKKGRTTLTAFAGSIGIMGIALILAVSQGMTNYIDAVQEDALSSYPLSIEETSVDLATLMEAFMKVGNAEIEHDTEAVYKKTAIYDMISAFSNIGSSQNDLKSFKLFLEEEYSKEDEGGLGSAITGLQYSYDLNLNVYTKNVDGDILKSDTGELLWELMTEHMSLDVSALQSMSSMGSGMLSVNMWQEILPGKDGEPVNDVLKKQYDVVYGRWPNNYDEIILVLDKNNELDDVTLYALGLESRESIDATMSAALKGEETDTSEAKWSYEEIIGSEYRVIFDSDSYIYDDSSGLYVDIRTTEAGLRYLYNDALILKVTGIIRPNENAQSTMLSGAIGYTANLTEYIVENSKDSPVVNAQKDNNTIDILTGLPFKSNTENLTPEEKEKELYEYLSNLSNDGKATAYIKIMSIPSQEQVDAVVAGTMSNYNRADMEAIMAEELADKMGVGKEVVENYISSMSDEEINELFATSIAEQFRIQYAEQTEAQLGSMDLVQLAAMLDQGLENFTREEYEIYYDEIMEFSDRSYEENLALIGYVDMDSPKIINIYASTFESKNVIEDAIKDYNEGKPELSQIKYTDFLSIIMSSINSIVNAITWVLLAFVAISLVVSSIMIGVITLISVQERTKEIGILRAIGASKSDVSSMFNAETVIIGLASGLLGVAVTYLLCIPINIILHTVTGIGNLTAFLPVNAAIILVLISIGLSLIAGFIPSRSAAKKDPVVALRTE
jgi:putative ABC transport system permease protein